MGLRLRHTSLFLTYVLAPLCAISNFNYEQVNPRTFPAAMLLHGRLSFRKPVLPSPSSGLVHRAFPICIVTRTSRAENQRRCAENKRTRWRRFELPNYDRTCVYFSAYKVAMQKNKLSLGYFIKKACFGTFFSP